jgi:uncharacterized protein (TIGR03435 family)
MNFSIALLAAHLQMHPERKCLSMASLLTRKIGLSRTFLWLMGASMTLTPLSAFAQASSVQAKLPEFEVASVKRSELKPSTPVGLFVFPGGRVSAQHLPLRYLIYYAFDVQEFQVTGGPDWMNSEFYDIEAKPPADSISAKSAPASFRSPPTQEQRQMLQSLLMDRFQLKIRQTTKDGSAYLLVQSGKPLKLQPPKDANDYPWAGSATGGVPFAHGIEGRNISMAQLAQRLSGILDRPVLDQTGLTGAYDFRYENPSDDKDVNDISTILISIQGIGLKLAPGKGPVETIVIDHAERPSAN